MKSIIMGKICVCLLLLLSIFGFLTVETTQAATNNITDSSVTSNVYSSLNMNQDEERHGVITDENGYPVPGLSITFALNSQYYGYAITDSNGYFTVPSSINEFVDTFMIFTMKGITVVKPTYGSDLNSYNFKFPSNLDKAEGIVTLHGGVPVPGIQVEVHYGTRYTLNTGVTDQNGKYSIPFVNYAMDNFPVYVTLGEIDPFYTQPVKDGFFSVSSPSGNMVCGYVWPAQADATVELVGVGTTKVNYFGQFAFYNVNQGNNTLKITPDAQFKPVQVDHVNPGSCINVELSEKDNKAPVVHATADRAPDVNGWYNHDVTVTFTATDDDDTPIQFISSPIVVTTDGANQYISGYATDSLGLSGEAGITINMDKSPPITTVAPGTPTISNTDIPINLIANDFYTGVSETVYRVNEGSWQKYTGTIVLKNAGAYKLEYRSTDGVGNIEAIKSTIFIIDKVAPVTMYRLDPLTEKDSKGNTYIKGFMLTLQAADNGGGSGVKATQYRINGGLWFPYTGPFTIYAGTTHLVEYFSTDQAGNAESPINKMDFDKGIFTGAGKF
ncbi:OmpL47-type beta-barrel domain-containing protein [Paenibacillus planticolens]|uniref:Bacterial Ig-like domain-containing protein n=1 Tax=Paenibacillus planticolens TaxID=2654976 RepID=A0ABX1ZF97_9BACL|nr:hypothetical protein [Paenibacillus planticolens]NOU98760.1 hypothetical protein [Paenibacillus planticolens]